MLPEKLQQYLNEQLTQFSHPMLPQSLTELSSLKTCQLQDGVLRVELQLPFVWQQGIAALQEAISPQLLARPEVSQVDWVIHYHIATLERANQQPAVKGVKNIIAISSGKGGVGKSTTAVNLALAMAKSGVNVGLLDADIYGPSIPMMLGATDARPYAIDDQHMAPIMAHQLATNSIGYLTGEDDAMVWRGPMASKALLQIINDTLWPNLDYLFIDMPPGTGDIQLTLAKSVPVTGAVIVTTPQDIALLDAVKGLNMFKQVQVPVLGIVENMSIHTCCQCGHQESLFGHGGAQKMADKYHTAVLAELPLHISLREDLDNGTPTVISQPDSELTQCYVKLADEVASRLYRQGKVIPAEIMVKTVS